MEQLTPAQRIEAYEYVLDSIKKIGNFWICISLSSWLSIRKNEVFNMPKSINYFPEFMALKPTKLPCEGSTGWWKNDEAGRLFRIAALEQCIKECLLLINQPTE